MHRFAASSSTTYGHRVIQVDDNMVGEGVLVGFVEHTIRPCSIILSKGTKVGVRINGNIVQIIDKSAEVWLN